MSRNFLERLRILDEEVIIPKPDGHSETTFFQSQWAQRDTLFPTLTWLTTNYWKQFPLVMMTEGASFLGKNGTIQDMSQGKKEAGTFEYEFPIMGEIWKNEVISSNPYAPSDTPGIGFAPFKMRFRTNWFPKGYVIESPNFVQVRIDSSAEPVGTEWEYTVRLISGDSTSFCPVTELEPGTEWGALFSPHSESGSEAPGQFGVILPGMARNCMVRLRDSYRWKGNAMDYKFTRINLPQVGMNKNTGKMEDKGDQNSLINYELLLREKQWLMQKENAMWYSVYNGNADGTFSVVEPGSGMPIKIGAGLLEQIPNIYSGSTVTYDLLQSMIYDVFTQSSDAFNKTVTMMTGFGGLLMFDRAMKDYLASGRVDWNVTNDKVVDGNGMSMGITGYFTRVHFIGGFKLNVIHNPVFDFGCRAEKSPIHPVTGRPLESHRMVFIDSDNMEGEPNIVSVTQKGHITKDRHIAGMGGFPSWLGVPPDFISHDGDSSSTHRSDICGIIMRRPGRSIHFIPELS